MCVISPVRACDIPLIPADGMSGAPGARSGTAQLQVPRRTNVLLGMTIQKKQESLAD